MKQSLLAIVGLAGIVASCSTTHQLRPSLEDMQRHRLAHATIAAAVPPSPPPSRAGYLLPQPDCPLPSSYRFLETEVAPLEAPFENPLYQNMLVSYFDSNNDGRRDSFEFRYIVEQDHTVTRPFVYGNVSILPDEDHPRTIDVTVTTDMAMDCIGGNEEVERRHFDFSQVVVPPTVFLPAPSGPTGGSI